MPELLNNINERAEGFKGKRLTRLLAIIFVLFLVFGLSVGAIVGKFADKEVALDVEESSEDKSEASFEGVVTYLEPFLYESEGITYELTDSSGDPIILLKAKDQKLAVSEGHFVTVYGKIRKTAETKENFLLVDRIVIRNAPN